MVSPICHHVYPGNVSDTEEFSIALPRLLRFVDENQMARDSHFGIRQRRGVALQHSEGIGPGLDFGLALEPRPGGIPRDAAGRVHAASGNWWRVVWLMHAS
jgi:hypothetical protein